MLWALIKFALGLALFAGVLWWLAPDWQALREAVTIVPLGLALALLGTALASVVTAYRWKLLTETMGGTPLPFGVYLHALVLTRFLGQFVPTLAMDLVGRGVALRSAGSKRELGHAATQVVVERLLDVVLPITLFCWALLAFGSERVSPGWTLLAVAVAFSAAAVALLRPMVTVALRAYGGVRRLLRRPDVPLEPVPVTPATGAWVVGLSLARFATVTLQFIGAGLGVGLAIPVLAMLAATAVAQIAGLLGFTPGGLGILEAGWAGGLRFVGRNEVEIGLFVLAQRLCIIGNFGLLSLVTLPLSGRRQAAAARRDLPEPEASAKPTKTPDPTTP